jgi:hypothetical protein
MFFSLHACKVPTLVSHGRKLRQSDIELPNEEWFLSKMTWNGLADLAKIRYKFLDPYLISAFVDGYNLGFSQKFCNR